MKPASSKYLSAIRTFLFLITWLLPALLSAQTFYVRQAATGSGNGLDWNNAYTSLPSALQRGAIYFIADGTYSNYRFDDPTSGSTYITIRKATNAAGGHGTDTGWVSTYGDGEAVFSGGGDVWTFTTGYYDMDGVVGYGKNPGSYGFRLRSTSPRSAQTNLIYFAGTPINGVRIRHTELDWNNGTATSTSGVTRGFDAGTASHDGTLFQSCYSHHSSGFHFFVLTSSNMTIERCYFYQNGGGGGVDAHWESFWFTYGSNLTFRHNYVDETVGVQGQTGWLMLGDMTNVKIYGNVFMGSSSSTSVGNNGLIATWSNDAYQNDGIRIINNTFVDLNTGVFATPSINFFHNSAVDNNVICKNNLYFNSNFGWNRITSHSHEAVGGGQNGAGSSLQSGLTSGIFSNYNADDFTLAAPTQAGDSNVGAEYNTDMNNRQRGSDGVWDRGAFEFDSNSSPIPPASLPNAPSDLRPTS